VSSIDLMIRGATIVTMNADRQVIEDGVILVSDDTIAGVLPAGQVPADQSAKRVIQADGLVAIPGLINAHSHLAMTLFRGFVEDLDLQDWLARVWKYELSALNAESVGAGSRLALAEMIRGGVTCAHDMYWHYEATMQVADEIGFRLISGPPITNIGGLEFNGMVAQARKTLESIQAYRYVIPIIQAQSTYTTDRRMMNTVLELKQAFDVPFTTHASENRAEVEQVKAQHGMTPIELLNSYHLLDSRTILAHCVHLRDDEIDLLKETGTNVAHCPESNLKLGSGIARVADMLAAGVNVCLGTDGAASNNDLNMLGEMRTAALLQKGAHQDPKLLTTLQALEMATINGAKAYGMDHLVGSLEADKKADIVLLDFRKLHLIPRHDVYAHLVYSANKADVDTVIIDGRVQLDAGRLTAFDEEALMAKVGSIGGGFH
jgi:5-methylthioadenosine/S-adenosylhomocysteine deaminase